MKKLLMVFIFILSALAWFVPRLAYGGPPFGAQTVWRYIPLNVPTDLNMTSNELHFICFGRLEGPFSDVADFDAKVLDSGGALVDLTNLNKAIIQQGQDNWLLIDTWEVPHTAALLEFVIKYTPSNLISKPCTYVLAEHSIGTRAEEVSSDHYRVTVGGPGTLDILPEVHDDIISFAQLNMVSQNPVDNQSIKDSIRASIESLTGELTPMLYVKNEGDYDFGKQPNIQLSWDGQLNGYAFQIEPQNDFSFFIRYILSNYALADSKQFKLCQLSFVDNRIPSGCSTGMWGAESEFGELQEELSGQGEEDLTLYEWTRNAYTAGDACTLAPNVSATVGTLFAAFMILAAASIPLILRRRGK